MMKISTDMAGNYRCGGSTTYLQEVTNQAIDTYLDRALNATDIAQGITSALQGDDAYRWFID